MSIRHSPDVFRGPEGGHANCGRRGGVAIVVVPVGLFLVGLFTARAGVLGRLASAAMLAVGPMLVLGTLVTGVTQTLWISATWPLARGGCWAGGQHSASRGRRPMTTTAPSARREAHHDPREVAPPASWKRFARHYLLMVVAMYAGMLVLDPVYAAVATRAGYADPWAELPVVSALVMAVNMTVPMVLLMLRHRHGVHAIVEMAASMLAPTLVATGLHGLGALAADQVMTVAHLAMFPAMLLAMLRRYRHYAT